MAAKTAKKKFKMSNGMLAYVSAQRKIVEKEAPKEKECPKCNRTRAFKFFGVRTHKDETGKPNRFSPQSYCVDCRSGKVVKGAKKKAVVKAKKVTAPKALKGSSTEMLLRAAKAVTPPAVPAPVAEARLVNEVLAATVPVEKTPDPVAAVVGPAPTPVAAVEADKGPGITPLGDVKPPVAAKKRKLAIVEVTSDKK